MLDNQNIEAHTQGGFALTWKSLQATQREVQAWGSAKKFVVPDKIKRVR